MIKQKSSGFTVLELVIVIVILSIVAFAAFVKTPGTSVNLDAQAERLANDIRYTQNLAMARNQHYRIVFDPAASSYTIQDGAENTDYSVTLAPTTLTTPLTMIIFNNKGTPYSDISTPLTNTVTITLTSGEATSSVVITPDTGRVTIS